MGIKTIQQTYGLLSKNGTMQRVTHDALSNRLGNNSHSQFLDGNTKICNFYNNVKKYDFACRNDKDGTEIGIVDIISQDTEHITFRILKKPDTTASIFYKDDLAYKWKHVTTNNNTLTINPNNQEIIVANNVQFVDNYNTEVFKNYGTVPYTDFVAVGYNTGNPYEIASYDEQLADSISFLLKEAPNEKINIKYKPNPRIQWNKITAYEKFVGIDSSNQMMHSNTFSIEGNQAINSALDRLYNVSHVIGMIDEEQRVPFYTSNFNYIATDNLATSISKLDIAVGGRKYTQGNVLADDETVTVSLNKISDAIGTRDYTDNDILVDSETITQSLERLNVSIGNRKFTTGKVLVDGETLTESLEKLSSKIGKESEIPTNNIIKASDTLEKNLNDIVGVIGDRKYSYNEILTDDETITTSLNKLDNFIHTEFYTEEFGFEAYESFPYTAGTLNPSLTYDENATTKTAIDRTKVVNNVELFSITDDKFNPIFKDGTVLKTSGNIVKVISYTPSTGTVTLSGVPKQAYRINYTVKYNRKNIPDGKIQLATNVQNIVDNSPTNDAIYIDYDNTVSKSTSTNVQGALDEIIASDKLDTFGVITYPTITSSGTTVTVGSNGVFVIPTSSTIDSKKVKVNDIPQFTTDTTLSAGYIYVDANSKTFKYTTDATVFEASITCVPVFRVVRDLNTVYTMEYGNSAEFLPNKMLIKDLRTNGFGRVNGLVLSTAESRYIATTSGEVYFGVKKYALPSIENNTTCIYQYYSNMGMWLREPATSSIDSTYCSSGSSGRATLPAGKWVSKYIYRSVGNQNELYYIHGLPCDTQTLSVSEPVPSYVPVFMSTHALYVGKIVIQQGATLGFSYSRDWGMGLTSSHPTNHNELSNVNQAGSGILNGHISDQTQTIYGSKTFDSSVTANINDLNIKLGTTSNNIKLGSATTMPNDAGTDNVGIGKGALNAVTIGVSNIAIGTDTLSKSTIGHYNVAIGRNSGKLSVTGAGNIGIGAETNSAIVDGSYNTSVGSEANKAITGSRNVALGYQANIAGLQ